MVGFIRYCSIRIKLMSSMLITSGVVLVMVLCAFFANDALSFRTMMMKDQTILANIVGSNTAAAVSFDDQKAAGETLEGLSANTHVIAAAVITPAGEVFALYVRKGIAPETLGLNIMSDGAVQRIPAAELAALALQQDPLWARNANIKTVLPFSADNQPVSTIVIISDVDELTARLSRTFVLLSAILVGALLIAYFISSKLQAIISEPLLHLAATMNQVTREKNYTIRAEQTVHDEVGDLISGFNGMLAQIELRDEQLHQYQEELEAKVALRTSEVSQANIQLNATVTELKTATEAANAASLAKSQFLANMSHEIRTPMNGMLAMTELLLESDLSQLQRQFANTIHHSSHALLSIINTILDFSKIEAGKLELEIAPFSIRDTTHNIVELFSGAAQRKEIQLNYRLSQQVPATVAGDSGRIRQILSNLINNAIKFTQQGEVSLSITQKEDDDNSSLLLFEVSDTGIGVAPEAQGRIFERFSQADGSMNRSFGGTGLGLTIARQLVELMGGEIGLRSETEKGSTFWFTLRLLKRAGEGEINNDTRSDGASHKEVASLLPANYQPELTADPDKQAQTHLPPHTCDLARQVPRILVVEDNAANQNLIITILKGLHYQVDCASNGREAIEAWTQANYDLLLMDGQMPVMDGFEATRIIREQETSEPRPRTTIIALTGQAIKGDRDQFLSNGIDDYLPKPFTLIQIRTLLNHWLPGRSTTDR